MHKACRAHKVLRALHASVLSWFVTVTVMAALLAAFSLKQTCHRSPNIDSPPDSSEHCGAWARDGECARNPNYMMEHCAESCARQGAQRQLTPADAPIRARERTAPSPGALSERTQSAVEPAQCIVWAGAGECQRQLLFMRDHCHEACAALDADERCAEWASSNQCQANAPFMLEKCGVACAWKEFDRQFWQTAFSSGAASILMGGTAGGSDASALPRPQQAQLQPPR